MNKPKTAIRKNSKILLKKFYHATLKICLIVFLNQLSEYLNLLCILIQSMYYIFGIKFEGLMKLSKQWHYHFLKYSECDRRQR